MDVKIASSLPKNSNFTKAMLLGCALLAGAPVASASESPEPQQSLSPASLVDVTGTVRDTNEPLIGATIAVKGEQGHGVVTDMDGRFNIKVKPGSTLLISYVGYQTKEVKASSSPLNVELKALDTNLNELVVIGYGNQRRESVTGSVANMSGSQLNQIAATSAAQALQGRIAGVDMTQTSSQPGAEMQIRIRGQRSLNASNDPLIVLDGVPFMGKLSDISNSDIKSIDILKDASATAIYGSRGSNGVIIITTMSGSTGAPAKVTYDGYFGVKTVFHDYPMMDGKKYSEMREYAGLYVNSLDESNDTNTDWQDLFFRNGTVNSHSVNVTGGTNGGSYSVGATYYNDQAVIPTQGYERYSLHATLNQTVAKYFKFGLTTNTSYRETKGTQVGLYNVLAMSPLVDPYNADGSLRRTATMPVDNMYIWTRDRLESLDESYLKNDEGLGTYNTLSAQVTCPWVSGLSYKVNVGLNYRSGKTGQFTGTGVGNTNENQPNTASVAQEVTKNWVVENILNYDVSFGKHELNVTGLFSSERTRYEKTYMSGSAIPADYFQYFQIGAAQSDLAVDPGKQDYWESGLMSWMGRVMYNYDNRYMASVAVRSDGSSRLSKGHQWHTYPAVSVGWNIANESFMSRTSGWLDSLKLRIGYGQTSNQSISPYSTLGALSSVYYNFGSSMSTGYYVSTLPNTELGWEYSSTWNFGLDFGLFNNRLTGSLEYYIQNTHDLLLSVNLPQTSGVGSYMANVGKTRNNGFELTLNGIILDNVNGWTWDAGINFYANRNKLVELASGEQMDISNRWFVGYPIDVIYDYKKIGLWQQGEEEILNILNPGGNVGMIKVEYTGEYDANGLPVRQINTDDRQVMSMEPNFMGGFHTTVGYKNFDLNIIGAFQSGGKLISTLHSSNGYLNMLNGRRGQIDVDYWTESNTDAKYPKPGGMTSNDNPIYGSTLGYFDASYMKIRAITLGYNFDGIKAVKNFGIDKLRVYFTVQNPFVLFSPYTNECGLDPETNTLSNNNDTMAVTMEGYKGSHTLPVVGYNTPSTRSFIFGVNLTF